MSVAYVWGARRAWAWLAKSRLEYLDSLGDGRERDGQVQHAME